MSFKVHSFRILSGLMVACITFGFALTLQNIFNSSHISWWLIATLVFVPAVIVMLFNLSLNGVKPPSDFLIQHAFDRAYSQKLRSMILTYPQGWKYKKLDRGLHSFLVEECSFQATISVELNYLDDTEINTYEKCMAFAVEFVKGRKSHLLFNRITERWGMPIHEFADQSPRTAGHHVTAYYHGTEYGFQLRLNDIRLAPASRKLFELFLNHLRFEPPSLIPFSVFEGQLNLNLPPDFVIEKTKDSNHVVWRASTRDNCTIEILKFTDQHSPMSQYLLTPLLKSSPRPDQAVQDLPNFRPCALRENGFGGYTYFQSNHSQSWFVAVGDLPSGGRYIYCLNDKDPRQEPFLGTYFYEQISYEILVTLSEGQN